MKEQNKTNINVSSSVSFYFLESVIYQFPYKLYSTSRATILKWLNILTDLSFYELYSVLFVFLTEPNHDKCHLGHFTEKVRKLDLYLLSSSIQFNTVSSSNCQFKSSDAPVHQLQPAFLSS